MKCIIIEVEVHTTFWTTLPRGVPLIFRGLSLSNLNPTNNDNTVKMNMLDNDVNTKKMKSYPILEIGKF